MDFSLMLQDYKPIDIALLEQKGYNLTEDTRNSFLLYNKALAKLLSNGEDIAIIELRKAISLNKDFIDAYNLLGICYLYVKDNVKAEEMFNKVITMEGNGARALKYLGLLKGEDGKQPGVTGRVKEAKTAVKSPKPAVLKTKEAQTALNTVNNKNILKRFLLLFATASLFIILIFIIIIFSLSRNYRGKLAEEQSTSSNARKAVELLKAEADGYKDRLSKSDSNLDKITSDLKTALADLAYFKNLPKLFDAEKLSYSGNYEEAFELLLTLSSANFKGTEKEKYDALVNDLRPKAAYSVYTQGTALFNSGNYKDAITKLSKVEKYDSNWQYLPWVMYQIGMSYKNMNDTANAISSFQKLKERFPGSEYSVYSDFRLKELKGE